MNKLIIALVASIAMSTSAFAESNRDYDRDSGRVQAESKAASDASNAGNAQNITFNTEAPSANTTNTTTLKNVPAIGAPALITSNDTCMGSTSGGLAVAGFCMSLGSTWSDKNCLMLKNSRELWNMGFKAASLARMCMDDLNKEALELTGFVCPTKKAEAK